MELGFQRYPPPRGGEPPPPSWVEEGEVLVRRAAPAQVVVALGQLALAAVCALLVAGTVGLEASPSGGVDLGAGAPFFIAAFSLMSLCYAVPGVALVWAVLAGAVPDRLRRLELAWWAIAMGWGGSVIAGVLVVLGYRYMP